MLLEDAFNQFSARLLCDQSLVTNGGKKTIPTPTRIDEKSLKIARKGQIFILTLIGFKFQLISMLIAAITYGPFNEYFINLPNYLIINVININIITDT